MNIEHNNMKKIILSLVIGLILFMTFAFCLILVVFTITTLQGSIPRMIQLFQEIGVIRWVNVVFVLPIIQALTRIDIFVLVGGFLLLQLMLLYIFTLKKTKNFAVNNANNNSSNLQPLYQHGWRIQSVSKFLINIFVYLILSIGFKLFNLNFLFINILEIIIVLHVYVVLFSIVSFIYNIKKIISAKLPSLETAKEQVNLNMFIFKNWLSKELSVTLWALLIISYAYFQHKEFNISNSMTLLVNAQLLFICVHFVSLDFSKKIKDKLYNKINTQTEKDGLTSQLDNTINIVSVWKSLIIYPVIISAPTLLLALHPYNFASWLFFTLLALSIFAIASYAVCCFIKFVSR